LLPASCWFFFLGLLFDIDRDMFVRNVCWLSTESSVISEVKYIHNHLCENLKPDLRFDEFRLTPGDRHCVVVDVEL
jgi:hypothetical protein